MCPQLIFGICIALYSLRVNCIYLMHNIQYQMTDLSLLLLEMLNIINMVAIYLSSLKVMIHGASFWAMLQSTFFWEDKDLPSQRAQVQVKSRVIVVKVCRVTSPQIWDSSLSQVTRVHNSGKVPKQHRLVTFLKKLPQVSSHLQKMLYFFCFA